MVRYTIRKVFLWYLCFIYNFYLPEGSGGGKRTFISSSTGKDASEWNDTRVMSDRVHAYLPLSVVAGATTSMTMAAGSTD